MKKLLLCITIILCVCTYGWTAGVPFTGSIDAEDVELSSSDLSSKNMRDAAGELYTLIESVSTTGVNVPAMAATTDTTGIDSRQMILENSGTVNRISWVNIISAIKASLAGFFQPDDPDLDSLSSGITGPVLGLGNGNGYQALQLASELALNGNTLGLNPTLDLSGYTITFGLEASDIPDLSATYEPVTSNNIDPDRMNGDSTDDNLVDGAILGTCSNSKGALPTTDGITDGYVPKKQTDGTVAWEADSTGAGGDQLVDIVTTAPLLVNGGANVNDALPGSDADITFSVSAATDSASGVVELSTDAESVTGTSDSVVVTPGTLTARLAAPGAIGGEIPGPITGTTLSAGAGGFSVDADGDVTAKSLSITRVTGQASYSEYYEVPANGDNKVTLKAPSSLAADIDLTLPSALPPSDGYIVTVSSTGVLSSVDPSTLGTGTGVTDGDKGDVTVSESGVTWTVTNVTGEAAEHPNTGLFDSDAPGTDDLADKLVGLVSGEYEGSAEGVEDTSISLEAKIGGVMTKFLTACGLCEVIHILKPIALPASTATLAPMNIPSGTAPSSPVEGDVYYDGTHLYFKPFGDAVDLLASSGSGSGSMTTVKEATEQVGGADIVSLDFGAGFDLTEDPDTEINVTLDLTEYTGAIGATGARSSKGWFTDIESTNMPTVGGTAILTSLTAPQFTTIELGAASDTTLSRSAAGEVSVEGVKITTESSTNTLTNKTLGTGCVVPVTIGIACSDETTALTTGTAKATFRMPHAMTLTAVRASVGTAPVGSTLNVDINEGGSSVLSTVITIDASEETSTTAATAEVISDSSLADDAEITIDIDQVGSGTAGAGLKVWLIGTRTL